MRKFLDMLKENRNIILIALIAIILLLVYHFNKDELKTKTTYTVINGSIESLEETNIYILKKETLVEYDSSLAITAVIEQGKRVSKREAIATYKSSTYDEYVTQMEDIDRQIQTLVKDMPAVYSSDISSIEKTIAKYAKEIQKTTSYIRIQEYKNKIDELSYKKVLIIANTSPDSSAIRDLIAQREELNNKSKESPSTIKAPSSGIASYKIDGTENIYQYNSITSMSSKDFDDIINTYNSIVSNSFGIKIVDNYSAYILVKTKRGDNDQYIKEGRKYRMNIADMDFDAIIPTLVKNIETDEYNYSLFMIENRIDDLVDYRTLSAEVIWNTKTGMAVPCNAVKEDTEKNYLYVTMVYGADYVRVPVKIVASSDSIYIVDNMEKEYLEGLGLRTDFKLELYDELIIE